MFALSHLVLVDLLLQDLISVRVDLHLLLFLQLPPQPGQILLEGIKKRLVYDTLLMRSSDFNRLSV